jgi:D-proline reductase (dithiol) PrdB
MDRSFQNRPTSERRMARLSDLPETLRNHLLRLAQQPMPSFAQCAFVAGPPLEQRRVALISTAGLHRRDDRPFGFGAADYRVIPGDAGPGDLVISHISTNFDRTGFQLDWNVMLPLERLREMAADGEIGSVAQHHYSFMGASDPQAMEPMVRRLASYLAADGVDAAVLIPV